MGVISSVARISQRKYDGSLGEPPHESEMPLDASEGATEVSNGNRLLRRTRSPDARSEIASASSESRSTRGAVEDSKINLRHRATRFGQFHRVQLRAVSFGGRPAARNGSESAASS